MRRLSVLALLTVSLGLMACQSKGPVNGGLGPTVGTGNSVATGGLPNSRKTESAPQPALGNPGVLLSGWAGNEIFAAMDEADRVKNQQAERRAFTAQVGQQVTWNNPESGHSGTIIPVREEYSASGAYCRDFKQSVAINGQQKQGNDHACQQPDGSWKITR